VGAYVVYKVSASVRMHRWAKDAIDGAACLVIFNSFERDLMASSIHGLVRMQNRVVIANR
jgi:hypothetical protein